MKEIKQFFRIEHPNDGKGLWRSVTTKIDLAGKKEIINSHSCYENIKDRHYDPNKFPTLYQDTKLYNQIDEIDYLYNQIDEINYLANYYFAFNTLEQLKSALTSDELKECINILGFKVLLYETNDYYSSNFQTIFKKETAILKEDISFMFI